MDLVRVKGVVEREDLLLLLGGGVVAGRGALMESLGTPDRRKVGTISSSEGRARLV